MVNLSQDLDEARGQLAGKFGAIYGLTLALKEISSSDEFSAKVDDLQSNISDDDLDLSGLRDRFYSLRNRMSPEVSGNLSSVLKMVDFLDFQDWCDVLANGGTEELRDFVQSQETDERLQTYMDTIRKVDSVIDSFRRYGEGDESRQIEELFPNADNQTLEKILSSIGSEFQNLRQTTDKTSTGLVFDLNVEGNRVYGKVSNNVNTIRREANYYENAWQDCCNPDLIWLSSLMRSTIAKPIGMVESDDVACFLSYGVENRGLVNPHEEMEYQTLLRELFKEYADSSQMDFQNPLDEMCFIDAFNRAISHTYMKRFMHDDIYLTETAPSVMTFDQIDSLLSQGNPSPDQIETIKALKQKYKALSEDVKEYDVNSSVLIDGDCKPENIDPSTRKKWDFGQAKPSTPEFDLGRLFIHETEKLCGAYTFCRNYLEQRAGNNFEYTSNEQNELLTRTENVQFLNSVRLMAGVISKNRHNDAEFYREVAHKME